MRNTFKGVPLQNFPFAVLNLVCQIPPDWKGKRCFILNSQKEFPVIARMTIKTIKPHGSYMAKEYSLRQENIDTFRTQHAFQSSSLGYRGSPRNTLKYWQCQWPVYCWFSCYLLGTAQMSKNWTESKWQHVGCYNLKQWPYAKVQCWDKIVSFCSRNGHTTPYSWCWYWTIGK